MNPLARELNDTIIRENQYLYDMLSEVGKKFFFPKGILTQTAEAKEKAFRFNATVGMATEGGRTMNLPSVMKWIGTLEPEESLTYAPSFGVMPLRVSWKKELLEKNPSLEGKPISLPVVTNALTHGLSVISDMWIDPGDAIILPDKNWGNYNMVFAVRRGARMVHYPLFDDGGAFNLKGFRDCLFSEAKEREKLSVILNFPNNPTGYTISRSEGEAIAEILLGLASQGTKILAISDDAYFGLFYEEDLLQESIFSLLAAEDPRILAIKVDGATKESYVWGLRVGFITYGIQVKGEVLGVYDALEKKTAGAVRGSISSVSHLSQTVIMKSLESGTYKREKKEKSQILQERALEVKRVLDDPKYARAWEPYPFNSGYFMCLRLRSVDAESLRVHLLDKYGIGVISLGARDLRIAFSCIEKEDVRELFDAILKGVMDLEH
ncbi:MAG: aminotransferase class I/II-fold pyridoxal phosphate-dependent enzyme [Deltaproteobacteria bacterium]|nr:aminotransferase class I/II-fold pyridoxal phosphate-dependent enzyme [Deltaproteobacteria bacterium]MBW2137697.1 aminotransferase class I/II-fold pyridoxal phosphate-dependent enzyme [Deltaproteobacteria bacterium]